VLTGRPRRLGTDTEVRGTSAATDSDLLGAISVPLLPCQSLGRTEVHTANLLDRAVADATFDELIAHECKDAITEEDRPCIPVPVNAGCPAVIILLPDGAGLESSDRRKCQRLVREIRYGCLAGRPSTSMIGSFRSDRQAEHACIVIRRPVEEAMAAALRLRRSAHPVPRRDAHAVAESERGEG
jgi:hypothetical protein